MSNMSKASEYKSNVIELLMKNDMVVKLLNPTMHDDLDLSEILLGGEFNINGVKVTEQGYIFDYYFIDDTIEDTKSFIMVEVDMPEIKNGIFVSYILHLYICSNKDIVRLSEYSVPTLSQIKAEGYMGNRVDALCDAIDRMLNGNNAMKAGNIGDVIPYGNYRQIFTPNNKFYGMRLTYKVRNENQVDVNCHV